MHAATRNVYKLASAWHPVQVESKGNTAGSTSRPSHADSPRSSSSALTSGDDVVMPHTLAEHDYELHMPLMANPRAYFRFPNATEAYRSHRLAVSQQSAALSSGVSSQSDGGHTERVLTDDSGLQLTGSTVVYNGCQTKQLEADSLKVRAAYRARVPVAVVLMRQKASQGCMWRCPGYLSVCVLW